MDFASLATRTVDFFVSSDGMSGMESRDGSCTPEEPGGEIEVGVRVADGVTDGTDS